MYGIRDYLDWRGDLSFSQSPLCLVDLVCFSQLAVLKLEDCVKKNVTLDKAFEVYAKTGKATEPLGIILPFEMNLMFKDMANSKRFASVKIKDYVYEADKQKQTQFSAITFDTTKERVVCFSGTDDTIVGWKENVNLASNKPTYAQLQSIDYLQKMANCSKPVYVIGHSKGGNLAMYSFLHCDDKTEQRIVKCYCFDGPGLYEKIFDTAKAKKRLHKMCSVLPQYSIIGRMFCHKEEIFVVNSNKEGLFQHDCFSWEVKRNSLAEHIDGFLKESDAIDGRIKDILAKTDEKQLESMFKSLFDFLYGEHSFTLTDIANERKYLLSWYVGMNKEDKKVFNSIVGQLAKEPAIRKVIVQTLKQMRAGKQQAEKLQSEFKNEMQMNFFAFE